MSSMIYNAAIVVAAVFALSLTSCKKDKVFNTPV